MSESDIHLSNLGAGGRRFERERGFADDGHAEREARLRMRPLMLSGGGIDSRGGQALPSAAVSQPSDARLWRSVREALLRDGYRAIDVSVRDGLIILEGTVDDIPSRVLAEDCCLGLPEVREVRNRLRVAPGALNEREVGG